MARRRGRTRVATAPIPENSITRPPSTELAPGQMDTDSLPPYEMLDAFLDDYVEKDMGRPS